MTDDPKVEQGTLGGKRQALILAAFARIASDGFEGLRTRDVAADVGINISTLHYYFPTKEDLIRATAQHMFQRFFDTLAAAGSSTDQLRGHLEALRQMLKTDPVLWAVASEVALRAARDNIIAGMLRESEERWHQFLYERLAQGVAEGSLAPGLQPDDAAATLMAAIKGLSMPWPGAFRPQQIDQTFAQLARWLGMNAAVATAAEDQSID